jgi:hypothetical protein
MFISGKDRYMTLRDGVTNEGARVVHGRSRDALFKRKADKPAVLELELLENWSDFKI